MKHILTHIWILLLLCNVSFAWFFDTPDIHGQRRKGLIDPQMRGSAEALLNDEEGAMEFGLNKRNEKEEFIQNQDKLNEALSIILRFDANRDGELNLKELYTAVLNSNGSLLKRIIEKL